MQLTVKTTTFCLKFPLLCMPSGFFRGGNGLFVRCFYVNSDLYSNKDSGIQIYI